MFHLGNSGTEYWLLHIVQCWSPCELDEEKWDLPMVLYYSGMMYKYYSCVGFSYIKQNEEVNDIHNEIFNNIPHFIKICLHDDFIQDGLVMYRNKILILKREVIPPIHDYMIPVAFCQNKINPSFILQLMTCHPGLNFFQRTK